MMKRKGFEWKKYDGEQYIGETGEIMNLTREVACPFCEHINIVMGYANGETEEVCPCRHLDFADVLIIPEPGNISYVWFDGTR